MNIGLLKWLWIIGVLLGTLVRAEDVDEGRRQKARALVQSASRLYDQQEYEGAEVLLRRAYDLYPNDKIQYSLGRVHEALHHGPQAMRAYERFLALPLAERLPQQTRDAMAAVERLTPVLGRVVVRGDPGTWFEIDGERQTLPAPAQWVEPGEHEVVFATGVQQIQVAAGGVALVFPSSPRKPPAEATMADADDAPAAPVELRRTAPIRPVMAPAPQPARRGLRAGKWILFTAGLLAVGAGAALWALDGMQGCDRAVAAAQCPQVLSSRDAGIAALAGGAAAWAGAGVLFGLDYRAGAQASRSAQLTVGGRF